MIVEDGDCGIKKEEGDLPHCIRCAPTAHPASRDPCCDQHHHHNQPSNLIACSYVLSPSQTVSKASKPVKALQKSKFSTSNIRKAVTSLESQNSYYRPDLQSKLAAKYSALANGVKVGKGLRKKSTVSTGRGSQE